MKKLKVVLILFLGLAIALSFLIFVPNSLGEKIKEEARANGYLEYTPLAAKKLAEARCTQCHQLERIAKYCRRCGPPFVVVITHMSRLINQSKGEKSKKNIQGLTVSQQTAVVQVWNALVGNWEKDFRREDLVTMIGEGNSHLLALVDTPVEQRKIEYGLIQSGNKLKGTYEEDMKMDQHHEEGKH